MKHFFSLMLCGIVVAGLAGCSTMDEGSSRRGPLLVGVSPDYPPVVFKEADSIVGVESDLAHLMAGELGRPVKFVQLSWNEQIPSLIRGDIDIIMSGMSITDARKIRINFSDPYMKVGLGALIRHKDKAAYDTPEKIMASDARIGVEKGTTGDVFVQQDCPHARRTSYLHPADAARDLLNNRIDIFIHDSPSVYWLASENEADLTVVPTPFRKDELAWGLRRNDQQLLISVNEKLADWKADGTLTRVIERWIPTSWDD